MTEKKMIEITMQKEAPTPFWKTKQFWVLVVDAIVLIALNLINTYVPGDMVDILTTVVNYAQIIILAALGKTIGNWAENVANSAAINAANCLSMALLYDPSEEDDSE